MIQSEVR